MATLEIYMHKPNTLSELGGTVVQSVSSREYYSQHLCYAPNSFGMIVGNIISGGLTVFCGLPLYVEMVKLHVPHKEPREERGCWPSRVDLSLSSTLFTSTVQKTHKNRRNETYNPQKKPCNDYIWKSIYIAKYHVEFFARCAQLVPSRSPAQVESQWCRDGHTDQCIDAAIPQAIRHADARDHWNHGARHQSSWPSKGHVLSFAWSG